MRNTFAAWWFRTFIGGDRLCPCAFWWGYPLRPICHWADHRHCIHISVLQEDFDDA